MPRTAETTPDLDSGLSEESTRIGRYLLGVEVSPELIERYRRAHGTLALEPSTPTDRAVMEVVRRRPWTLSYLDAASGVLRPHSLLRKKIMLMFAILETSPELAPHFEAESPGRARAVLRLLGLGAGSAFRIAAGVLLWPLVAARTRALSR